MHKESSVIDKIVLFVVKGILLWRRNLIKLIVDDWCIVSIDGQV